MIKALVTIIDDETGIIYDKDKLISPTNQIFNGYIDTYVFRFNYVRANDKIFGTINHTGKGDQE